MKSVQVREAEATLSSLVDEAEQGHATVITKHGKAAAYLVPVAEGIKLYPKRELNFGEFLLQFPGGLDLERSKDGLREVDL